MPWLRGGSLRPLRSIMTCGPEKIINSNSMV
jgi:hypothetical protein